MRHAADEVVEQPGAEQVRVRRRATWCAGLRYVPPSQINLWYSYMYCSTALHWLQQHESAFPPRAQATSQFHTDVVAKEPRDRRGQSGQAGPGHPHHAHRNRVPLLSRWAHSSAGVRVPALLMLLLRALGAAAELQLLSLSLVAIG